jgi:cobalt-zinc-cadmium efflux system protein
MHEHKLDLKERNLILVIIFNIFIFIIEILGGIFSKSLSLLSDSFHNLSDTISIVISLIAYKFSKKENSFKFTFGGKRAEIFASFINSIFLFIVSILLFKEAIIRFFKPEIINLDLMTIVAILGLILNGMSVFLLKRFTKDSINIKSSYIHLLMDTLSSIVVVISAIIMRIFKIYWIDPLLTILIIVYILKEGFGIFIKSTVIILEGVPKEIDLESLKKEIENIDGVLNLHHVHVWQLDDKNYLFEGHIELNKDYPVSKADKIREITESILKNKYKINHSTIQIEYNGCCEKDLIKKSY